MKQFVLSDNIVTSVRILFIILTLLSTISINQTSLILITITLLTLYGLKKESTHKLELIREKNSIYKTDSFIINQLHNPFKNAKKLEYSELPKDVLEKAQKHLLDYFIADYSYAESLEGFKVIRSNTECRFAKNSNVWGAQLWNTDLSLEKNVENFIPSFILFCNFCTDMKLDGYLVEIPVSLCEDSVEGFAKIFCKILKKLSDCDPGGRHSMNSNYIDKSNWVFEFCKMTFFITTFTPFYKENHPRYAFGAQNCYILFQPEISFALHDLPADTPHTQWDKPVTIRDKIRVDYKNAGRPYFIRDTIHYPMAHDMIRPLNNDHEIVKWWLYKEEDTKKK